MKFIVSLEEALGKAAEKEFMEIQPGDVLETYADTQRLEDWVDYHPNTDIHKGISVFVDWYQSFFGNKR